LDTFGMDLAEFVFEDWFYLTSVFYIVISYLFNNTFIH
jgi:hypothetical protein